MSRARRRVYSTLCLSRSQNILVHDWSMDRPKAVRTLREKELLCRSFMRVSDGIRTRDRRDHNPELYQLSYAHQAG